MDYVKLVYRPLAARAARQALVGRNRAQRSPDRRRFTRAEVNTLLKAAWGEYAARVVKLVPEPTVGSRMNVKLACFTMSFFNALLGDGTERAYAIELVADAVWRVYRLWSSIALGMARVTPGKTTSLAFAVTNHGDQRGRVSLMMAAADEPLIAHPPNPNTGSFLSANVSWPVSSIKNSRQFDPTGNRAATF